MKRMTDLDATWSGWRRNCTDWTITGSDSGESGTYNTGTCGAYENEWLANWKICPCVTERFYDNSWTMNFTDDKPGNNAWLNGETGRRFSIRMDSASNPITSGLGQSETDPVHHEYWTYRWQLQ